MDKVKSQTEQLVGGVVYSLIKSVSGGAEKLKPKLPGMKTVFGNTAIVFLDAPVGFAAGYQYTVASPTEEKQIAEAVTRGFIAANVYLEMLWIDHSDILAELNSEYDLTKLVRTAEGMQFKKKNSDEYSPRVMSFVVEHL